MNPYQLDTPEAVQIDYQLAGIGTRFLAAALDTLIGVSMIVIVAIGAFALSSLVPRARTPALIVLGVAAFILVWGYYTLFETLWNGQTPGKQAMRIRVIKTNGYSISFLDAVVRNLVRYVDWLPTLYGVGVVTMFISRESRRLGDYAAGTVVIREQSVLDLWAIAHPAEALQAVGLAVPAGALHAEELTWDLHSLTGENIALIRQFLDRAPTLPAEIGERLGGEVSRSIARRIGAQPGTDTIAFLNRVVWLHDHPG